MLKKILFTLSLLIGIGAFFLIPVIVGVDNTWEAISEVGIPCILAYLALCVGTQIFPALGWWLLLRAEDVKVSPLATLRANLMGFPINFFTPSMYLGSEPLKAYFIANLSGAKVRKVMATIIVSKFQELTGIILVLIVSTIYFVWNTNLFNERNELLLVVASVILAGLIGCGFYAFINDLQPTVRLIHFLALFGLARRKLVRLRSKAIEMEKMIHAAFVHRWKRFLAAQAITFLSSLTIYLRPVVFFFFLPKREVFSLEHISAIYVITNLVNLITIIPGSLGIYEGGIAGYFELADLGSHRGLALTLVNRLSDLALLILGGWLLTHYGLMRIARGKEKVTLEDAENKPAAPTP